MRIISWNVNGIRSRIFNDKISSKLKKDFNYTPEENSPISEIIKLDPDIICLQETRCSLEKSKLITIPGYNSFFNESNGEGARSADRYSGTCIFFKQYISAEFTTQIPGYNDNEGRIIVMRTDNFTLVNVYSPNSGSNYDNKILFNDCILKFLSNEEGKIIFCGDLNVAKYTHFDQNKCDPMPGIYPHELKFIQDLENNGFKDTMVCDIVYTWWDPRQVKEEGISRCRNRNKGWKLDYFFTKNYNDVSSRCIKTIGENRYSPLASDHAPIILD